jgi:hypothetical protein
MDLAWSEDGMKIVAVGDGNESMGKVFTWDSGTFVLLAKTIVCLNIIF